jgi:hypothetical protein
MTTSYLKANIRALIISLIMLSGFAHHANAQDEAPTSQMRERMEAYKIAFITERLELTSKEATGFWPVYNEFEKQMRELKRKQREESKEYRNTTPMTDKDADKFLTTMLELKHRENELLKKYIPEFRSVLPIQKVAKLIALEDDFKTHIMRRMYESKDKEPKSKRQPDNR